MSKKVLSRTESDSAHFWRLEDIIPSNEAWEKAFIESKAAIEAFSAHDGKLTGSAQALLNACQDYEKTTQLVVSLFSYARMRRDEDNANTLYQGMTDRVESLMTRYGEVTSFMQPQIMAAPEGTVEGYLSQNAGLAPFKRFLEGMLRYRPHTLSEAEERLLAMSGDIMRAPNTIYSMLTTADVKFPEIKGEDGETVQVSQGRFIPLLESKDRRVRKDAYEAFYTMYKDLSNTLANTYAASCKGDVFAARARKFDGARAAALFENEITLDVYDNLVESIHQRLPDLNRYIAMRKRLLGLDELRYYDIYVPLFEYEANIPYERSTKMVMDALRPLGNQYLADAAHAFTDGWIDVYENTGKTSGAYSWGCYGTHPFILLNHQDTLDSAFTLAHELGHAMHSFYSDKNNTLLNADYPIFLAEVASTTNELLMIRYMIDGASSKEEKQYLLNHLLEQFRTTVFRQCMFAEFEKGTHEALEAGEALTAQALKDRYQALNEQYYSAVAMDDFIPYEWSRIPHFYRAFYVYQYSTGFCAAVKLSDDLYNGVPGAQERYLGFLSAGGSKPALEILKDAGVDMTKPGSILQGLDYFAATIDALEATL